MTNQLYRAVRGCSKVAPIMAPRRLEVRRFVEPPSPATSSTSIPAPGGWASPSTYSLAVANLAAECLALICGATLLACEECDAEEDWS